MKKVLVYEYEEKLAPIGGPLGYLYNLKLGLEKVENNVHFLHQSRKSLKMKKKFNVTMKKLLQIRFLIYIICKKSKNLNLDINFNAYEFIHFHSTLSMYLIRDSLKNYKGKIILTSHSPEVWHVFYCEYIKNYFHFSVPTKLLEKVDIYAFNKADYIVFPCKEAEEPYNHTWFRYADIKKQNDFKYRYLLTGSKECKGIIRKRELREKFQIPKDAYVVSFVGGHTYEKGYDILKKIAKIIFEETDKIYFLIAGKIEPMKPLVHSRWIEIGWTNDPHSIINISDLFILPNRETYFDLILLETLSLGKLCLLSNTGGNRYFQIFDDAGIFFFDSVDDAKNKIKQIYSMSVEDRHRMEKNNFNIFEKYFTVERFAQNYMDLLDTL